MRLPGFPSVHPRGRVLVDLACAIVLGAEAIGDIALLEHQRAVLGQVASPATVWRVLDEMGARQRRRIARARAAVRRRMWKLLEQREDGFCWIAVDGRPLAGGTADQRRSPRRISLLPFPERGKTSPASKGGLAHTAGGHRERNERYTERRNA
ncbi:hypothetical protein ACIP69_37900 [Streptomyces hygroscopicus]|uniref:hypothetical protein n=1 Tax=Streptomyces hygroscopicus TaxID=1912 RepID=UPI0038205F77